MIQIKKLTFKRWYIFYKDAVPDKIETSIVFDLFPLRYNVMRTRSLIIINYFNIIFHDFHC